MSYEMKLPNLGENVDSAEVANVLVAEGDTISADQDVIEVETGKAAMPVPCPEGGVVESIKVSAGDTIAPGDLVLVLGAGEDAGSEEDATASDDGNNGDDETEASDDSSADVEEGAAPASEEQQGASKKPAKKSEQPSSSKAGQADEGGGREDAVEVRYPDDPGQIRSVPASPSVRRFAREIGIAIEAVAGSGRNGRVTVDDVKAHAREQNRGGAGAAPSAPAAATPLPDLAAFGPISEEPLAGIRRATAAHMAHCWATVPHVTQFARPDITDLEDQRKQLLKRVEQQGGGKLTVTAIVVKLAAVALRKFPQFNVSIDPANNRLVRKDYVHIGVAVDTPRGLVVPVLRDVEDKNIIAISEELGGIAERARDGKLGPDDMRGGCFTISNLGGIGGDYFTPIVNWPEVAILGVSRAVPEVAWDEAHGTPLPRLRLPLSLSYDHRAIDGADGARFLQWLGDSLSNPLIALLEG